MVSHQPRRCIESQRTLRSYLVASPTTQFVLALRQFAPDFSGVVAVPATSNLRVATNNILIPIQLTEMIKIIRAFVAFEDTTQSGSILAFNGFIGVFASPSVGLKALSPIISNGVQIGNQGLAGELVDVEIYGTDFAETGFAPPAIQVTGAIDVHNNAAAPVNVSAIIGVLFERYQRIPAAGHLGFE